MKSINQLVAIVKRNAKIYFTSPMSIFFSLLGALISFFIVALLLRDNIVKSMAGAPGVTTATAGHLIDTWLAAGAAVIASATTPLAACGQYVNDRQNGAWKDFIVTPTPRWIITLGYLLSSLVVSVVMTTSVFVIGVIYAHGNGAVLGFPAIIESWGELMLCSVSFTALMTFVASFISNERIFSLVNSLIGTIFGFLAGVYMNFGSLGKNITTFLSALPFAQATSLVRKGLMKSAIDALPLNMRSDFNEDLGVVLHVGSTEISRNLIICILVLVAVIGYILSYRVMARKSR